VLLATYLLTLLGGLAVTALMSGCASIGAATLPRDRFDYSSALSESWKYQTLLNAVKLRYMDTPIFVDVAQVISAYQLETVVNAGGTVGFNSITGDFANAGVAGRYTDRPTITYTPLTGDQYVRGLMTPIRPEAILSSILAGWPADAIMFTAVTSINGLTNQRFGGRRQQPADPRFLRLITVLRQLQESLALGFRLKEGPEKERATALFFGRENLSEEDRQLLLEAKRLLRLNPDESEYRVVFGATASSDREIAMQTRSLLEIMSEVGAQVDIPPAHITEGRATPGLTAQPGEGQHIRFIHIHSSRERSAEAFLSIRYRDHWFWIDDRDLLSKRNFTFLMLLFSLADTGEKKSLPVITIPAQ
jgi:hypothetical protein